MFCGNSFEPNKKAPVFQRRLCQEKEHPIPYHFYLNKLSLCYRGVLVQLFQHPISAIEQLLQPMFYRSWHAGKRELNDTLWEKSRKAVSQWKRTGRFHGATLWKYPCRIFKISIIFILSWTWNFVWGNLFRISQLYWQFLWENVIFWPAF